MVNVKKCSANERNSGGGGDWGHETRVSMHLNLG